MDDRLQDVAHRVNVERTGKTEVDGTGVHNLVDGVKFDEGDIFRCWCGSRVESHTLWPTF